MKNLKSLLVIAILSVVSFGVSAQTSASVSASADVQTALTITKNTDINFGAIGKETPSAIVLDAKGVNHAFTGVDRVVGTFTIVGDASATIDLIFPSSLTLSKVGADDITVTLDVNGADVNTAQATSTDLSTGADLTTHATNGNYFLWVGGSIPSLASGQVAGTYTGTATFTVAYN
jgi:hypothetical protein